MLGKKNKSEDTTWLSLSDMMTVLMVLFLILAIYIAVSASQKLNEVTRVINSFIDNENKLCQKLKNELYVEFNPNDLNVACEPIRITFVNEKYKFDHDSHVLKEDFKVTLTKFFPIYLNVIDNWNFTDASGERVDLSSLIDEVRIEGHTDSAGSTKYDDNAKYLYNMTLSQKRSKSVLNHVFKIQTLKEKNQWMRDKLTANGLSYSRRLNTENKPLDYNDKTQTEDKKASRRIEIKLRTKAREIIKELRERY